MITYHTGPTSWQCLDHTLGSDHHILQLRTSNQPTAPPRTLQTHITDWAALQEFRTAANPTDSTLLPLSQWTQLLDVQAHQQPLDLAIPSTHVDARLHHMWEALRSLKLRWHKQQHNRQLKTRIALLIKTIKTHCQTLVQTAWDMVCDSIRNGLSMKRTWALIRHLIDPTSSCTIQTARIAQLARQLTDCNHTWPHALTQQYVPNRRNRAITPIHRPP